MHELSLAYAMVEEIEAILDKEGGSQVKSVTIDMGKLSGVQSEPFEFAFPIAVEGTRIDGASLTINKIPIVIKCNDCDKETELDIPYIKCGHCGSRNVKNISGKEFLIKSLEIV